MSDEDSADELVQYIRDLVEEDIQFNRFMKEYNHDPFAGLPFQESARPKRIVITNPISFDDSHLRKLRLMEFGNE